MERRRVRHVVRADVHRRVQCGASHFGVADLEALARDVPKLESRYFDGLVGPYPAARDLYVERSPVHHVEQLSSPMILFQGADDEAVRPSQAREMSEALRAKGFPVALLVFDGEGRGFRQEVNIKRALEAELYFYSRVFGFELAEPVEPVEIDNLP
jgi:dipeptidyl aminopeptidase/acylaminoacyl peptidase